VAQAGEPRDGDRAKAGPSRVTQGRAQRGTRRRSSGTARSKPRYSKSRIRGEIACGSLQVALQSGLNGPVRTDFITKKHAECRYRRSLRRGYGGPGIDEVL